MDGTRDIPDSLYDRDFAAWAEQQARALRARAFDTVDWENVIEEIETLGRSERSALRAAIALILEHRIKLDHGLNDDPKRQWTMTVRAQQRNATKILKDNPSLRPAVAAFIFDEYDDARGAALDSFELYEEAQIDHYRRALPEICPYTQADILP